MCRYLLKHLTITLNLQKYCQKLNCHKSVCYLEVFLRKSIENVPIPKKSFVIQRCLLREVSLYINT